MRKALRRNHLLKKWMKKHGERKGVNIMHRFEGRNTGYYTAYYKDCNIFDKVAQIMKKENGDKYYCYYFDHIDSMINAISTCRCTGNKEILNLLTIFKDTMYDYRALRDEGQKYRDKEDELLKKGCFEKELEAIDSQSEKIGQQTDKCTDIMIQQLEKGYLMFLEIKDQRYWSIKLGVLKAFILMCDVLGFDTSAARKKAQKKIEKRRIEKIVENHLEEKLSKIEKKLDELLSKEGLNNGK